MKSYYVIVYPPLPAKRGPNVFSADSGSTGKPGVQRVQARTPEHALENVHVAPGGHAIVVIEARRFDRAPTAPLVEKSLDGNPLPRNEQAA